jgi:hypothetical protein
MTAAKGGDGRGTRPCLLVVNTCSSPWRWDFGSRASSRRATSRRATLFVMATVTGPLMFTWLRSMRPDSGQEIGDLCPAECRLGFEEVHRSGAGSSGSPSWRSTRWRSVPPRGGRRARPGAPPGSTRCDRRVTRSRPCPHRCGESGRGAAGAFSGKGTSPGWPGRAVGSGWAPGGLPA